MLSLPSSRRRFAALFMVGACAGLAACGDQRVTSYRVPKEPGADQAAPAVAAATAPNSPVFRWMAPAGWQEQPAGGMRQGSFVVPGADGAIADVSVVSFPGSGGDDLANINRWRAQVSLAPISAAELSSQVQSLKAPAGEFIVADLVGIVAEKGETRILGSWLRQPDRVWFFKMMGPSGLVEGQKDAFTAFLRSVSQAPGPAAGLSLGKSGAAPSNTNDLPRTDLGGMNSMPVQAEGGASLLWQAPADWQNETGKPMRKGSYAIAGGAEVAITAFPGDVGGVLANVNRWRGQAGLDPVDEAGLSRATVPLGSQGLQFLVVDAQGGSSPIVAALLPWNGGTWFFKLTGPADAVAKAEPAFLTFLKTVHTP